MSRETCSSGTEWGRPTFNDGHSTPETEISILCLCFGTCFSRRISCFIVRENKKFNSPSPAKPLITYSVSLEYSRGGYLGLWIKLLRHPPFFLRLPWNAFPKKKITRSLGRYPRTTLTRTTLKVNIHIFGLTKCTIYSEKCSCFLPVFLYAVTMLIFHIKRITPSEKWCNYVVAFFLKMPKICVGRTTVNGEKREDGFR